MLRTILPNGRGNGTQVCSVFSGGREVLIVSRMDPTGRVSKALPCFTIWLRLDGCIELT